MEPLGGRVPEKVAPAIAETDQVVGKIVSHYEIIQKLGAGGMGEVYLAEDRKLNRQVAIKLLPQNLIGDETAKRRLMQEAQAAARLDHPNICAIYEIGEAQDNCFIVMQYVQGESLASKLAHGSLSLTETLVIATQITDALCEAHSRGIVHRDIKPQNIMITPRGLVKVLDFGLARFFKEESPLESHAETIFMNTAPGMTVGTIPYMSPEQLKGQKVDNRSDIFSFGVLLFEMVAGKHPFSGDTGAEISANILMKDPPQLSTLIPDAPPGLQAIISKALAKSRVDRYQTGEALLGELTELRLSAGSKPEQFAISHAQSQANTVSVAPVESAVEASRITDQPKSMVTASAGSYTTRWLSAVRKRPLLLITLTTVLLGITGASLSLLLSPSGSRTPRYSSIAVMPIQGSGNSEMEYLSDGVTEGLIKSLSELPNLKVIASTSVFRYRGQEINPTVVGDELNVNAIVTGRIMRRPASISVSVELVDTTDGTRIWGETITEKNLEAAGIPVDLTRRISDGLRLKLTGTDQAGLTKRHTDNPEAYRYYLQGRYYWNKQIGEGLRKAREYYQRAIELDSSFALAHAGLAESWILGGGISLPPVDYMGSAERAAEEALRLDPALVEAHVVMAKVKAELKRDWAGAEAAFERSIELNPNYATAYQWYADHLIAMSRFDEASTMLKRAYELDPLSLSVRTAMGDPFLYSGNYDAAIRAYRDALEMDQGFLPAHYYLGIAYELRGLHDDAIAEFKQVLAVAKGYYPAMAMLGYSYAKAGKKSEAEKMLEQLLEIQRQGHISTYNMVVIYAGLDRVEDALEWLRKGYEAHAAYLTKIRVEPLFLGLRNDPRFQELVDNMRFP